MSSLIFAPERELRAPSSPLLLTTCLHCGLCVCLRGAGDGRFPRVGRSVTPQGNGVGGGCSPLSEKVMTQATAAEPPEELSKHQTRLRTQTLTAHGNLLKAC